MSQQVAIRGDPRALNWLVGTAPGQSLLREAYDRGERPLCCCCSPGVEMYVARRGSTYYLARLPGSGFLHAESCASFDLGTIFSGAFCYTWSATADTEDGRVDLAYAPEPANTDFPLGGVGINGLFDFLIEEAGINAFAPEAPPQTWATCRKSIMDASTEFLLNGKELSPSVWCPPRFEPTDYPRTERALSDHVQSTLPAFVIAPLKSAETTEHGWRLALKHLPHHSFWLHASVARLVERHLGVPMSSLVSGYCLVCLQVDAGRRPGNWMIRHAAIRATDRAYMPCPWFAPEAAAPLKGAGAHLLRPLRFDCSPAEPLADFVLTDQGAPCPVFLTGLQGNTPDLAHKHHALEMLDRHAKRVQRLACPD